MKTEFLEAEFVEYMPQSLKDGILYVSMGFGTAIHNCCCGCGNKVVTPLSPTDWKLIYDGENISLSPSIGNWSFPCQSHYWIRSGKIEWSGKFSKDQVDEVRKRDKYRKSEHFERNDKQKLARKIQNVQPEVARLSFVTVVFKKLFDLFR